MGQREDQWLSTESDDELAAREVCRTIGDALPDPRMQAIFRLCARGERTTSVFAAALGVERLPLMEQRRLIKREKDRLLKLLHRNHAVREIVRKGWSATVGEK